MNHQEALKVLDLQGSPSEKEINAAFKKKAKLYHPDVCKDADAADKFKLANQAKDVLENPPVERQQASGWGSVEDILRHHHQNVGGFNPFAGFNSHQGPAGKINPHINIPITIDFKSAILGSIQNIQYKRQQACIGCRGTGRAKTKIACSGCGGKGYIHQHFTHQGGTLIQQTPCGECYGQKVLMEDCSGCGTTGTTEQDMNLDVSIPAGITNATVLNLGGAGNYSPGEGGNKSVFLNVSVPPHPTMWQVGDDVHSKVHISLLEALEGTEKTVEGVMGDESIRVPPMSKGGDAINIPTGGVGRKGQHVVSVDIDYGDAGKLIEFLKSSHQEQTQKINAPVIPIAPNVHNTNKPVGKKRLSRKQRKQQRK